MTQRHRVLDALKSSPNGVTNAQFVDMRILRFGARLEELREAGYEIETKRVSQGIYSYRLLSAPTLETGAGAPRGTVHSSLGHSAQPPAPVCDAKLFETETNETVSAITGKAA